jgi:hypothetical protein
VNDDKADNRCGVRIGSVVVAQYQKKAHHKLIDSLSHDQNNDIA